jgi:CheY-like chemotaxis protein
MRYIDVTETASDLAGQRMLRHVLDRPRVSGRRHADQDDERGGERQESSHFLSSQGLDCQRYHKTKRRSVAVARPFGPSPHCFRRDAFVGGDTENDPIDACRTIEQVETSGKEGCMAQKTVLVVEDDPDIRDIVQDLLESEGYDVVPASHGRQALEFLSEATAKPDLVILDMMMPLVDGRQVLETMQRDPVLASIPVLVISAVAREKPAGAAAFLRKPVSLEKLFETVRTFIKPSPLASLG